MSDLEDGSFSLLVPGGVGWTGELDKITQSKDFSYPLHNIDSKKRWQRAQNCDGERGALGRRGMGGGRTTPIWSS